MPQDDNKLTEKARAVRCPFCGAEAGKPCHGKRNPTEMKEVMHNARYEAAQQHG